MAPPRLALWGTFDVDNYGDHLFPRVAVHELRRRLPGAAVDVYSPYGRRHPTPLDSGAFVARPLGPWTPGRAAELAAAHDTVVVGGGEIIHLNDGLLAPVYGARPEDVAAMAPSRFFVEALGSAALERRCPVVWHAVGVPFDFPPDSEEAGRLRAALAARPYITVRDRFSRHRLVAAGVDRPVEVVPDSALLLDRVLPPAGLAARVDRLRALGHYPPGPALVIQGCDLVAPFAPALAAELGAWLGRHDELTPAVIETGRCRGDALFAGALAEELGAWRIEPGAGVEDMAAAISGGAVFMGSSLHGAVTALVYGRPFVLLNLAGESKLDGFADLTGLGDHAVHDVSEVAGALETAVSRPVPPGLVPDLQRRIDAHFDRIAEIALAAARR